MNKLEPVHEKAIDLFVAGKRQNEIAAELDVNPRTLRRWSDSELFIKELHRQHAQARKLEQDEQAEFNRRRLRFHELVIEQLETLLKDPNTPPQLRAACLKLGMQDMQSAARQREAQEWREKVHAERKAERLDALNMRATIKSAGNQLGASAKLMEHLMRAAEKADKSGQAPSAAPSASEKNEDNDAPSAPEKADKSGHPPIPPIVQPVKPFRYPRPEKKPDAVAAQAPAQQ